MTMEEADILHPLATLCWEECCRLPVGMDDAHCVCLNGRIYLGGGGTGGKKISSSKIFISSSNLESWTTQTTPTYFFALTTYHSQLVLVGGNETSTEEITNKLWVSDGANINWQPSLPPMPTKRSWSSAISAGSPECLIVAGGWKGEEQETDAVEVLTQGWWSTVQSLPKHIAHAKIILYNENLYIMGGFEQKDKVFYCKLASILVAAAYTTKVDDLWSQFTGPTLYSSPAVFGQQLITVGGFSYTYGVTCKIHVHSSLTEKDMHVGDVPIKLKSTCTAVLPSGELLVIGGFDGAGFSSRIDRVFKASVSVSQIDPDSRFTMSALSRLEGGAGIQVVTSLTKTYVQLMEIAGITVDWENQRQPNPDRRIEIVIHKWETQKSLRPPTWRSLLDILRELGMNELSQQITDYLYGQYQEYLTAYRQILNKRGYLDMFFLKFVFVGPPRMGKTSTRRRLTGEIADINSAAEHEQPSTGTVESGHIVIRNLSCSTAVIVEGKWSSIKDLSEEARMLLQFFYETNSYVASKPSSTSPPPKSHNDGNSVEDFSTDISSEKVENVEELLVQPSHEESDDSSMFDLSYSIDLSDMFMKAMASKDWKKIKYVLEYTALIKMEDTGGQPEFMDMLPALVMGPSLYFIFCRLIDDLKSRYRISYLSPSGEPTTPMESTYTVEEVILQALSAVACSHSSSRDDSLGEITENSPLMSGLQTSLNSVAFIVGTHKDLVSDDHIAQFDEDLKNVITNTSFYKEGLVEFATENRLVLAIDNMNGGVKEVETIRKFLEERIKHHFKKISIPAAWLVFSLCLRKRVQRTISLQSCEQLARHLGMPPDETRLALWFLHHHAGVLMHFPDVPELYDTVICDVQIVFDSVTNMIVNTFKFGKVKKAAQEIFKETGQFSLEDIRKALAYQEVSDSCFDSVFLQDVMSALVKYYPLWKVGKTPQERAEDVKRLEVEDLQKALSGVKKDYLPLDQLVKLLVRLNIIAPVDNSNQYQPWTSFPQSSSTIYLMPCILQNATEEELDAGCSSPLLASLMIRYVCGFVPLGVFPAMIANLVGHSSLILITEGIKKNRVKFLFGSDYDTVTLISRPTYYEIQIARPPAAKTPTHVVCSAVRDIIESALKTVSSCMNYAFSFQYQISFVCPLHSKRDHLCVVDSRETSPHIMCCLKNIKNPEPVEMLDQHLVWFGKSLPVLAANGECSGVLHKILVECHDRLVTGLQAAIGTVSSSCFARSLISEDTYKFVLELNITNAEKTRRVLLNVKQTIQQQEEKFQEFVDILHEVSGCGHLAKELMMKKGGSVLQEHSCVLLDATSLTPQIRQPPQSAPPTKPRLLVLCKELKPISEQWMEIGLFLDLTEKKLKEVESNHGPTPFQCMKEMWKIWLAREQPAPTWESAIEVLEFLGHEELAYVLRQRAMGL